MKAFERTRYGSADVLVLKEVEKPVAGKDQLLIKIICATVNRTDCAFLLGKPFASRLVSGLLQPRQRILGNEFAGVIERVGSKVRGFSPGDAVFGYNDAQFGAHAEYITIKESAAVCRMPERYNYDMAAALTEGAHYALCNLRAANVKPGQSVLVNGATGAIGSAAVQLAKHFGATVTAVCHTLHTSLLQTLGADTVVDYMMQDFTKLDRQFDLVFDAVGKSSFAKCKSILKEHGIYVSTELGRGSQNIFLAMLTSVRKGKKVIFPIPHISKTEVLFLKELAEQHSFTPLIDRRYKFSEIPAAYEYVLQGQKIGNVIIDVAEPLN